MDPSEDILLNGKPYRVDITSYREKDLADFSPRATVPGGSITQSELMLYQPLNITDWRHGLGFTWHTDAMGYMYSMGNIDTRQPGIAMLFTAPSTVQDSGDSTATKTGMTMFNGDLYTWGSSGLRKLATATGIWSSIYSALPVTCALATDNYLFFSPSGGRIQKLSTGGVLTNAGHDGYSTDYSWFCVHKGYIYAGKNNERRIHYGSDEELDDLEGGGPEDPAENQDPALINIGGGKFTTTGAISFGQELFVFRKDSIWVLGSDNVARRILDFTSEADTTNFVGRCVFNGYLYFSVRNKIFQWNGSRLVDVTPPRITDQFPYSEIKTIGPMLTANNFLYMIANWNHQPIMSAYVGYYGTGTYTSLFCYDGIGWHKLADLVYSGGLPATSCLAYDPTNNRMYLSVANSTAASRTDSYFSMGTTNLPASPYKTGANSNVLISSRLDMGFRRVKKFSPSILIEASNISFTNTATDRYLSVYAILGLGEASGTNSMVYNKLGDIKQNGVTQLYFPGVDYGFQSGGGAMERPILPRVGAPTLMSSGGAMPYDPGGRGGANPKPGWGTMPPPIVPPMLNSYNYIILLVEFITNDYTQSPILEGMTLRFLLRPDVFYGYNFNIIAASRMVYGDNQDTRTAGEIIAEIKAFRDSKLPVQFTDIYGNSRAIYISSVTNQAVERHDDDQQGVLKNIEGFVNINCVEAR